MGQQRCNQNTWTRALGFRHQLSHSPWSLSVSPSHGWIHWQHVLNWVMKISTWNSWKKNIASAFNPLLKLLRSLLRSYYTPRNQKLLAKETASYWALSFPIDMYSVAINTSQCCSHLSMYWKSFHESAKKSKTLLSSLSEMQNIPKNF